MIVRLFVKVILLNALSTLFQSQSNFGVSARVVLNSGCLDARSVKPAVDRSCLLTEDGGPSKRIGTSGSYENILRTRGGQVIKGKKKKSPFKALKEVLEKIVPATRSYLLVCAFCTLIHVVGLPAPELFSLDKSRLYEIWRPITSVAYFGAPSMSMANNLYFLVRYGQTLEELNGTGAHAWFLLMQTLILTILGFIFGFPFQASAMISATVYASSHLNPMEIMPFQFGFMITSWQLPFCMMGIDCLSQQSVAAAVPHVLGIFSGHCYHFFTKVWPALGGKAWLDPPKWFVTRFGGRRNSNIPGVDFRKNKDGSSDTTGKGKKAIKRGVARKLGGGPKK